MFELDNGIHDSAEESLHCSSVFYLFIGVECTVRWVDTGGLDDDYIEAGADPDVLVARAACCERVGWEVWPDLCLVVTPEAKTVHVAIMRFVAQYFGRNSCRFVDPVGRNDLCAVPVSAV